MTSAPTSQALPRLPDQRTAVVTGAGGLAGIGRVTAQMLAENGWQVALVDTRDPPVYTRMHLPGAVNIPLAEIGNRLAELHMLAAEPVLVGPGPVLDAVHQLLRVLHPDPDLERLLDDRHPAATARGVGRSSRSASWAHVDDFP